MGRGCHNQDRSRRVRFVRKSACHIVDIVGPIDTGVMDVTVRGGNDVVTGDRRIVNNDCGDRFVMRVVGGTVENVVGTEVVVDGDGKLAVVVAFVVGMVDEVELGGSVVVVVTRVVVGLVNVIYENVVDVAVHSICPFYRTV